MGTRSTQNSNLFRQQPSVGDRDLGIVSGSGCISMQLSTNESGTLYAGSRIKLDSAITAPMPFPQVVAAADAEAHFGVIARTAKQSAFVTGDVVEVLAPIGPIVYVQAAATIAPGADVEMASGFVQTKSGGAKMGVALDPAVLNSFLRVVIA